MVERFELRDSRLVGLEELLLIPSVVGDKRDGIVLLFAKKIISIVVMDVPNC